MGPENEGDERGTAQEQSSQKEVPRRGSKRRQNVVPSDNDEDDVATANPEPEAEPSTGKKLRKTKSGEMVRERGKERMRDQEQATDVAVEVEEPEPGKGKGKGRPKTRTRPVSKRASNANPQEVGETGAEEAVIVRSTVEEGANTQPKLKRKAKPSATVEDIDVSRDNGEEGVQEDADGGPDNGPLPLRRASRSGKKASDPGPNRPSGEKSDQKADTGSRRKQPVEDRELLKTAKSWMADTPSRRKTRTVRFGEDA